MSLIECLDCARDAFGMLPLVFGVPLTVRKFCPDKIGLFSRIFPVAAFIHSKLLYIW